MNQFSVKRLSVLIGLAFAANATQAQFQASTSGSPRTPADDAATATLLSEGPGVAVGSFLLFPELTLKHTYDSNIFAANSNTVSDFYTTPGASITGRSNWSRHKLSFEAGIDSDNYLTNNSQDVYNYWLGFEGQYDLSPGNNIFGGVRHSRENEERGTANPLFSIDPTSYYSTKAHIGSALRNGPVVVRFGASAETLDYVTPSGLPIPGPSNNDDRDQFQYSVGARIGYELSPALMPFVQVATDTRDYNRSLDDYGYQRSSNGYRASIGAVWKPDAKLNAEAFLGKLYQRYDDDRFGSVDRPYFGASLTWKPQPTTRLQALIDRALDETTIPGASGSLDTTVAVDGEHAVSGNLVANARVSFSRNDYQGTSRNDKVAFASTGFRYYIDPVVFLGVDLRVVNRNSSDPGADYFRNQLMFSLGYTPGRKKLGAGGDAGESGLLSAWAGQTEMYGSITPKLAYFGNSGNSAYVNRYDYLAENLGGNGNGGFVGDLDFNLLFENKDGAYVLMERQAFGENSQRMRIERHSPSAKLAANYSTFTSATGTLAYFFNPDRVTGGTDPTYADPVLNPVGESTHVGYFNNDSPGVSDYRIKRTTFGASVLLQPKAFNEVASIELGFDGYKREGRQVTNYVLDSYSLTGAPAIKEPTQWRGYAKPIDEQSGRMTYNFTFAPFESWLLNYEFSVNKFENKATPLTFNSLSQLAPSLPFDIGVVDMNTPLHYNPDSTLYSNSLRVSKQFGDSAALSGGANISRLEQNTFSDIQNSLGYTNGRTDMASGYLIGKFNASRSVGLEAFVRYSQRDNKSSYPVAGFYDPVSVYGDERMVMPRIDKARKLSYGIEAKFYPSILKTSWSAGWLHEEKDNNLTYGVEPVLAPPLTLSGERYSSDEIFLKMVARPARGWTVRVTPSYLWAKRTQLTTDPNEMFKLKTSVAYTQPAWHELAITGYYNYKHKKNDSLSYSDYNSVLGFNSTQNQKVKNQMQAAGVNLSLVPDEGLTVNVSYDWTQNDLSAYYFATNRLRFHYLPSAGNPNSGVPLDFLILDQTNYNVDNHAFNAGFEKQWGRYLFAGNYSLNLARGHNANGLAGQTLPEADDKLDNLLQTLSFGVDYAVEKNMSLRALYIHDHYTDKVNGSLSGDRDALWLGVNLRY